MKHSLALLLCSWLVPTLMLGSCGSTRSVELVGGELAEVTSSFLASLDADQQKAAQRAIDHEEVMKWHFVPGRYAGVEMGALDPGQRRGADEVLRTMLSATGFAKAMAIVDLENVLHELESRPDKPAVHRDPNRYALLVCGTPKPGGTFVVRYQGHHLSLRMAVVDGMLGSHSPHFLGTNPHRVPDKWARTAPLGREEDLARELLTSTTILPSSFLRAAAVPRLLRRPPAAAPACWPPPGVAPSPTVWSACAERAGRRGETRGARERAERGAGPRRSAPV